MSQTRLSGFGLRITSDSGIVPSLAPASPLAGAPSVHFRWIGSALPPAWFGSERTVVWETTFDGCPFRVERDRDGQHFFLWGDRASFRLSADSSRLDCAAADSRSSEWRRLLLDTVLWSVSLLHGYELLHASAVVRARSAVAFVAGSGGGKSSVAAELMRRGAELLCDDMLALTRVDGAIVGHPGPPVMNLPIAAPSRPQPSELGRLLGVFADEYWIGVDRHAPGPLPLTGVCVIERRNGASTALQRWRGAPLALLPQFVGFPGTMNRLAVQLDLASTIAASVPVYLLTADPRVTPEELASLVEETVFETRLATTCE